MNAQIPRPAVFLITRGLAKHENDHEFQRVLDVAARAAEAGVDVLQVRERQLPDAALLTLAARVRAAVELSRTRIVVNERVDVAIAARADGVHLRGDSMPAPRVRAIVPDGFLIGRSVHSAAEAIGVEAAGGADYLIFGTVFPSASKPADRQTAGLAGLEQACRGVRLPVIAIGGMNVDRAASVAAAGASGLAAIGLFADAESAPGGLGAIVRQVRQAFGSGS